MTLTYADIETETVYDYAQYYMENFEMDDIVLVALTRTVHLHFGIIDEDTLEISTKNCFVFFRIDLDAPKDEFCSKLRIELDNLMACTGCLETTIQKGTFRDLCCRCIDKSFFSVDEKCPICLEEILCTSKFQTECGHIFHTVCWNKYIVNLQEKSLTKKCPLCRTEVPNKCFFLK
jgi:hypothetical protein